MNSLELVEEYYNESRKIIKDGTMLLYGSTAFGVNSSDIDLCFIRKNELDQNKLEELKKMTHDFHKINNLRIDEEVPYDNKLIYTYDFINQTISNPPFPFVYGKYNIPNIEKTREYLNSVTMKKRLLLNILTVKHNVYGKLEIDLNDYINKAWDVILKIVISYAELDQFSIEQLIECLLKNPINDRNGEMYLGYKQNMIEKIEFLNESVQQQLERLEDEDKVCKKLNKLYIPNRKWVNSNE